MATAQKQPIITWEYITPSKAQAMLDTMKVKRHLVKRHLLFLTAEIQNGRWVEGAGDPIRFNTNGALIDGQHRLKAIIASGATLKLPVLQNAPLDAIDVVDTGRYRGLSDYLSLHGETDAPVLAGALSMIAIYNRTGGIKESGYMPHLSHKSASDILQSNPGLRDAIHPGRAAYRVVGHGASFWTAIYYILHNIDAADADAFFSVLTKGGNEPHHKAINLLRNRLSQDRVSGVSKLTKVQYTALTFKAWNFFRKGEQPESLLWRGGGASPERFPAPM